MEGFDPYSFNKIFRDPVHNYIEVTAIERCLIDTPWMQRLRNIIHMATAQKTYMSAHSSRFEHSIGVLSIAGKIIESLDKRKRLDEILTKCSENNDLKKNISFFEFDASNNSIMAKKKVKLKQIIRLIALLHDIGHGPFSHSSEGFLEYSKEYRKFDKKVSGGIYYLNPHEIVGLELMLDYLPEGIEKIKTLPTLGEKELISLGEAKNLLSNKELIKSLFIPNYEEQFNDTGILRPLCMIINSQIDADKLDYLLRDTYTTGVEFGKIIDLERLLKNYDIDSEGHLCLTNKALSAAESLVEARYKLYKYLYHHHIVCLTDEMLRRAILHGKNGKIFGSLNPFSSELFGIININDENEIEYTCIDDFYVYQKIREHNGKSEETTKAKFYLKRLEGRKLFRALWKISEPPSLIDKNFFDNGDAFNKWKKDWLKWMIDLRKFKNEEKFLRKFEDLQKEIWKESTMGRLGNMISSEDSEAVDDRIIEKLNETVPEEINWKNILSTKKTFSPYSSPFKNDKAQRINIIIEKGNDRKSKDLEELSPLIESLSMTWSLYQGLYGTYVYLSDEFFKENYIELIPHAIKQAIKD